MPSEDSLQTFVPDIEEQLRTALEENKRLRIENERLQQTLKISRFSTERYGNDDFKIRFFTGFVSHLVLSVFLNWIRPSASLIRNMYYNVSESISLAGRRRNMPLMDELFMFTCRMRLALLEEDLADRFDCTIQTVSRKILTWVNIQRNF